MNPWLAAMAVAGLAIMAVVVWLEWRSDARARAVRPWKGEAADFAEWEKEFRARNRAP